MPGRRQFQKSLKVFNLSYIPLLNASKIKLQLSDENNLKVFDLTKSHLHYHRLMKILIRDLPLKLYVVLRITNRLQYISRQ